MATKIILIRHGITEWNRQKRYCGFFDISLSDKGKIQAGKLRERLILEKVHRVYCSDRKRAIHTAKIIFNGSKIKKIPGLREMHFGIFEGLSHNEIIKRYHETYKKWLRDPFRISIPKGENLNTFKKRVGGAFKKIIAANPDKNVAVICHGGVISVFITAILKSGDFWKYIPRPASISIVEHRNGKEKIRLFNDTSHLHRGRFSSRSKTVPLKAATKKK